MNKTKLYLAFKEKVIRLTYELLKDLKSGFSSMLKNPDHFAIFNINPEIIKRENPDFIGETVDFHQRYINFDDSIEKRVKKPKRSRKTKKIKKMRRVTLLSHYPFTPGIFKIKHIEDIKQRFRTKEFRKFGKANIFKQKKTN